MTFHTHTAQWNAHIVALLSEHLLVQRKLQLKHVHYLRESERPVYAVSEDFDDFKANTGEALVE